MLSVSNYDRAYVDQCRARTNEVLVAYEAVAATAKAPARSAFEAPFLAQLVFGLDASFVHRARTLEGKDGNPLNEVRMLCASLLTNGGHLEADSTIKYKPDTSVLGLQIGDEIRLDLAAFRRLAGAYFDEVERKFVR